MTVAEPEPSADPAPIAVPLAERGVFAMTGADVRPILQDVVTANVAVLAPGRAVYTALLTPQGKYLFDFFLLDDGSDGVLIDVQAARANDLARRLSMYCMRRDARVASGPPWQVAQVWGAPLPPADPAPAMIVPDPRADAMGWRVYAPDIAATLAAAGGRTAPAEDLAARRIAHGVPESGVELVPDDTYILEVGLDRLGGVDFRKGCYVGQEVTARMRHKTQLRKGLVQVRVSGAAEPGTPILREGKPVGTLFSVAEGAGLAHLRFDRAGPGMEAGSAVVDYVPAEAPAPPDAPDA